MKKSLVLLCAGLLVLFSYSSSFGAEDHSTIRYNLRLGSASTGSTNQVLLTGVATVVSRHSNLRVSAITTQGSTENVRLLQDGELELASINGDAAYAAFKGTGHFTPGSLDGMSQLFSTFSNQGVFVTLRDSGIERIEDLAGRRISAGPAGSGAADLAFSMLYHGYGMWDNEMNLQHMSFTDGGEALRDGTIDAMQAHLNSGVPAPFLAELDVVSSNLRILGLSDEAMNNIQREQPFQRPAVLNRDTAELRNLREDEELIAMENFAVIYARDDIPVEVVYAFVRIVMENAEELDVFHRQGTSIRIQYAMRGLLPEIPVHPGAAMFFKEAGVWNDAFHTTGQ